MGYMRGIVHGMLLGAAAALLYAPKPGRELRQDLSGKLDELRGGVQPVLDQAQDVVDAARPQVQGTISTARQKITRKGGASSAASAGLAGVGHEHQP